MEIYLLVWDNLRKLRLIPDVVYGLKVASPWKQSLIDESALD